MIKIRNNSKKITLTISLFLLIYIYIYISKLVNWSRMDMGHGAIDYSDNIGHASGRGET